MQLVEMVARCLLYFYKYFMFIVLFLFQFFGPIFLIGCPCQICFALQNGNISSIKPQQVTYIVPGIEDFDQTDIPAFINKAQDLLVSGNICDYQLPSSLNANINNNYNN